MTDLTRFSVDGCMEPDDEGQWVRYEDVAAPVAPALKYVDDPKQTGVGSWCAPGPAAEQKRMFVLRFEDQDRGEAHYTDEAEARAMFARAEARGWNCHLFVHVNRVAPVAPAEPAEGWVLVPKRMTQEMRDVTDSEGWTWEDLLAEAGSISQEEYAAIAAAPVAPTEWTDAKLRGIASDYFPDRAHWPAAMLCLRHLLMEQSKFGATVAPVDHDEFSLFRNDLCDFLRHVIDMGKGDHYWDVVRGNAGALLRRVARIAPAVAPVAPAGDKPAMSEPVGYHDKHQPNGIAWCPGYPDALKDIAPLYAAAPPDAQRDAERLHWLREWLVRHGLLHALFCQPEAGMKAGDFWVLRKPYIVNGDGCEGYGKTEDEAIDAAMAAKEPT